MQNENHHQYIVVKKIAETPGVSTIFLTLENGEVPKFIAGQFVTIYFPELGTAEGKAYSISNAPGEDSLAITVRAIGQFSNRLCALQPGDILNASLPYGYFYSEEDKTMLVLLAAGIGIAPFHSIIHDSLRKNPKRKIALFYSERSEADLIFKDGLGILQGLYRNFNVHYFITREKSSLKGVTNRRMQVEDILGSLDTSKNTEFTICGSISFVRELWRALCNRGVKSENIHTEAFFS